MEGCLARIRTRFGRPRLGYRYRSICLRYPELVRPARVRSVAHLRGRVLRLSFSDSLVRELDFSGTLTGILATIDDDFVFATMHVDDVAGTVCWPGGIDLDPDVLHGDHPPATGAIPRLIREYRQAESV